MKTTAITLAAALVALSPGLHHEAADGAGAEAEEQAQKIVGLSELLLSSEGAREALRGYEEGVLSFRAVPGRTVALPVCLLGATEADPTIGWFQRRYCRDDDGECCQGVLSPDERRAVMLCAGDEPESDAWLVATARDGCKVRLKVCGTSCALLAAFWLDELAFAYLVEHDAVDFEEYRGEERVFDRRVLNITMVDLRGGRLSSWETDHTVLAVASRQ